MKVIGYLYSSALDRRSFECKDYKTIAHGCYFQICQRLDDGNPWFFITQTKTGFKHGVQLLFNDK